MSARGDAAAVAGVLTEFAAWYARARAAGLTLGQEAGLVYFLVNGLCGGYQTPRASITGVVFDVYTRRDRRLVGSLGLGICDWDAPHPGSAPGLGG